MKHIILAFILAPGGDPTGFFGSTVPAFFLNAQLFTKGLFKTIYPF